jgi:hypothetical protein
MENQQLLYDTGPLPPVVRIFATVLGAGALYGSTVGTSQSWLGTPVCVLFGVFFLSAWFWRTRIYYQASHREIVRRGSSDFWIPRHISLAGAAAVYLEHVRVLANSSTDVGIRYQDGHECWLTRIQSGDPGHLATVISEATGLPVSQ